MEVAGLVLEAVPIFMAATSQYKKSLDCFRHFRDCNIELPKFVRRLRRQRDSFWLSLKIILLPCFPKEIVSEMLVDPRHYNWTNQNALRALEAFHGQSYAAFNDAITDIAISIAQLGQYVGLGTIAEGVDGREASLHVHL